MDMSGDLLVQRAPELLPLSRISEVEAQDGGGPDNWLIHNLWLSEACGIIGGPSKCRKTWYGLELCISVASGTPALGHFEVSEAGPALVYLAEDKPADAKARISSIASRRGIDMSNLDLHLITAPSLRLDDPDDRESLCETVHHVRPKILLLDPLIRMHRVDENSSREISGLLSFLRAMQREFQVAVVITHHANKKSYGRCGDRLRGSSDLHAFGDSNTYIFPKRERYEVTVEHRAAPSLEPFFVELTDKEGCTSLELCEDTKSASGDIHRDIMSCLGKSSAPIRRTDLRSSLHVQNTRLGEALGELERSGMVQRSPRGWALVNSPLFDQ